MTSGFKAAGHFCYLSGCLLSPTVFDRLDMFHCGLSGRTYVTTTRILTLKLFAELSIMHPFQFTTVLMFTCTDPDSRFVFDPLKNNSFHWYGKDLDKIGTYAIVEAEQLYIILEWNFRRERKYTIVSTLGTGDEMKEFVIEDNLYGKQYSFSR